MKIEKGYCDHCATPVAECTCLQTAVAKKPAKHFCRVMQYGRPCGKTINLYNVSVSENPVYWCEEHYAERRFRTDTDREIENRTKVFVEAAKQVGMTNRELCEDLFPQWFKPSKPKSSTQLEQIKKIVNQQNPLYGNLIK